MLASWRRWWLPIVVGSLSGLGCSEPARGEDEGAMRRVDFRVERTRSVANDWVRAVIGATDEDLDAAALADRINRTVTWALGKAKGAAGVEVKSGGYHTSPVYQDRKLRRWRASQDLILESQDAASISAIVGVLQERLQLRSIGFSVSPALRRTTEDALIQEALAAFRARAELVRESLGARGYQIVRVSIDTGGGPPVRPMYAEARAAASSVAPPALEAGSSELAVHVSGTIELE